MAAIDAKQVEPGRWEVFTYGGRKGTGIDVLDYAAAPPSEARAKSS